VSGDWFEGTNFIKSIVYSPLTIAHSPFKFIVILHMNRIIFLSLVLTVSFSLSVQSQSIPSWKITNLQKYIDNTDSILVVNFWATFCKPCIKELPYIQSISEKLKDKGVRILLVSLDLPEAYPVAINNFAKINRYKAPIVWLNETDADYFCPKIDQAWSGTIPTTLFINRKKGYRKLIQDQMDRERFEKELKEAL
jgi:thiol-disulfide isomerase/thioredoxin